jgi:hypothetical protein
MVVAVAAVLADRHKIRRQMNCRRISNQTVNLNPLTAQSKQGKNIPTSRFSYASSPREETS